MLVCQTESRTALTGRAHAAARFFGRALTSMCCSQLRISADFLMPYFKRESGREVGRAETLVWARGASVNQEDSWTNVLYVWRGY